MSQHSVVNNYEVYFKGDVRYIRLFFIGKTESGKLVPVEVTSPLEDHVKEEELPSLVAQSNMMALKNGIASSGLSQLVPLSREDYLKITIDQLKGGADFVEMNLQVKHQQGVS